MIMATHVQRFFPSYKNHIPLGAHDVPFISNYALSTTRAPCVQVQLHPQSVWEVPGVWHGGDHFGGFGDGSGVLAGEAQREDCMDRIRFFAEECDSMQVPSAPLGDSGRNPW